MRADTSDAVRAVPLQCIGYVCPMPLFILIFVFYGVLDDPWNIIVPVFIVAILVLACLGLYFYLKPTHRRQQVANNPTKPLQECIKVEL